MYVSSDHKNWDTVLPYVTYAYNTAKHETTGYTPFFLIYARNPGSFLDTILPFSLHEDSSIAETLCRAEEARRLARLRTLCAQSRTKDRHDGRHLPVSYAPGDLVWLWTPLRKRGLHQKFLAQYAGPFVVLDQLSELNYVVARLTSHDRRSPTTQVTHVARMKPCYRDAA